MIFSFCLMDKHQPQNDQDHNQQVIISTDIIKITHTFIHTYTNIQIVWPQTARIIFCKGEILAIFRFQRPTFHQTSHNHDDTALKCSTRHFSLSSHSSYRLVTVSSVLKEVFSCSYLVRLQPHKINSVTLNTWTSQIKILQMMTYLTILSEIHPYTF